MKRLFLILSLLLLTISLFSQSKQETAPYEIMRKRLRVSDDPMYLRGDTLYLLYDPTDSLQFFGYEFWWMYRDFTQEEMYYEDEGGRRDISLVLAVSKKIKTLTYDDLKDIHLTLREEYLAFYEREYKRLGGKMYVWNFCEKMDFRQFDPLYYFKKVYVIVPDTNGTFRMYRCDGLSMVLV